MEMELQRLERKDHNVSEYDHEAKLTGKIRMKTLVQFLQGLGYQFRSN